MSCRANGVTTQFKPEYGKMLHIHTAQNVLEYGLSLPCIFPYKDRIVDDLEFNDLVWFFYALP